MALLIAYAHYIMNLISLHCQVRNRYENEIRVNGNGDFVIEKNSK